MPVCPLTGQYGSVAVWQCGSMAGAIGFALTLEHREHAQEN